MWQTLRSELHPLGVEIVTVSLELGSAEESRPFIEAADPQHPSLLDPEHQLDALFGVVNIPNVIWINEDGVIVRPAEPGWPGTTQMPGEFVARMMKQREADASAAPTSDDGQPKGPNLMRLLQGGQDRQTYADAIRDWADRGSDSPYAMDPDEVMAASQPRSMDQSRGAAHFELANHFWQAGDRASAIVHFNECHRLQPENWTYKRQAWSLFGRERVPGDVGVFLQNPVAGQEADWPFVSSFDADVARLEPGQYYPKTI